MFRNYKVDKKAFCFTNVSIQNKDYSIEHLTHSPNSLLIIVAPKEVRATFPLARPTAIICSASAPGYASTTFGYWSSLTLESRVAALVGEIWTASKQGSNFIIKIQIVFPRHQDAYSIQMPSQ
jgi:hypothetical protein